MRKAVTSQNMLLHSDARKCSFDLWIRHFLSQVDCRLRYVLSKKTWENILNQLATRTETVGVGTVIFDENQNIS